MKNQTLLDIYSKLINKEITKDNYDELVQEDQIREYQHENHILLMDDLDKEVTHDTFEYAKSNTIENHKEIVDEKVSAYTQELILSDSSNERLYEAIVYCYETDFDSCLHGITVDDLKRIDSEKDLDRKADLIFDKLKYNPDDLFKNMHGWNIPEDMARELEINDEQANQLLNLAYNSNDNFFWDNLAGDLNHEIDEAKILFYDLEDDEKEEKIERLTDSFKKCTDKDVLDKYNKEKEIEKKKANFLDALKENTNDKNPEFDFTCSKCGRSISSKSAVKSGGTYLGPECAKKNE